LESIMNSGRNDGECISRRVVLTGAALALGAAATATAGSQAAAQQKASQGAPKGNQRCDGCASFQAPNACKVVEGDTSPSGWCQLFVPKA
jgi:hypothetical protein